MRGSYGDLLISLFSLSEIIESGRIGGDGAAKGVETSARVKFARILLGGAWEGVGLRFTIVSGFLARLVVDINFFFTCCKLVVR